MRYFSRRFPSLLAFAGTALLLMGAGDQVKSSITSSATNSTSNSVMSRATASITSGMTKSGVMSRATGSITSSMTNSLSSRVSGSAAASVASRATATHVTLSPAAEELARAIRFDREIFFIVHGEGLDRVSRLIGFNEEGYQIIAPGIAVSVPEDRTDHVLSSLRKKLFPLKYMAFVVEMNEGLKMDKIGILKGTDQYEILRIMHTDGDDYDISNQDVIDRLKEWEIHSPFDIIGADNDWVEIEFRTVPKDLDAFAEEVYDFCPDAVDQGPGSVEGLIKDIKKTKRLFLWWD